MTTALQDWTAQVQGIVKGLLDEAELTGDFLDVEKESIRHIVDTLAQLGRLCDVMPEPCNCVGDQSCSGWQTGFTAGRAAGLGAQVTQALAGLSNETATRVVE